MPLPRRTHCKTCNIELNEFNCNHTRTGFYPECKVCQSEYAKNYRNKRIEANPNYTKEKHWKSRGVSPEQYKEMWENQDGKCAICRQESDKKLCIDHNHETDEVRALLCYRCNSLLGLLNDDYDFLWKIYEYLKVTTWNKKPREQGEING